MAGRAPTPLPHTHAVLPNWALAVALAAFTAGTYAYSARATGAADLLAELEAESKRQEVEEQAK